MQWSENNGHLDPTDNFCIQVLLSGFAFRFCTQVVVKTGDRGEVVMLWMMSVDDDGGVGKKLYDVTLET